MGLLGCLLLAQEATWLDKRKRLPPFEAARKRPGWIWTAYPAIGYDPNRGIGAALSTNVSYNGRREDSLFRALPYRHFARIQIGFFQREVWYGRVGYEWLWPKGRPYRIMLRMEGRQDGQIQLWGSDAHTLSYRIGAPDGRLSTYYQALKSPFVDTAGVLRTREAFHRVLMQRFQLWIIGERLLAHGLWRLSGGLRYLYEKPISLANSPYRLNRHQTAQQAPTLYDSLITQPLPYPLSPAGSRLFLGAALIWDSRDFEVDPHKGLLLELSQEIALGRPIYKTTLDLRSHLLLYENPKGLPRLTLALRSVFYSTYGQRVPLWDLYYLTSWSEARRFEGLSGPNLLRGYRENRFIAPFGQVHQMEMRLMLFETKLLRQNFVSGLVTLADLGTGTNRPTSWPYPWKSSLGIGGRVVWNFQTILRADAAYSREGWQIIFTTRHTF